MADFALPDLGEGVSEAEVDRWVVAEGDAISEDQPLVEVITDKATVEIPSPFSGIVERIHVRAGDVVPVGTVLVSIASPDLEKPASDAPAESQASEEAGRDKPSATSGETGRPGDPSGEDGGPRATPPVRKLARSLGIDISEVAGTGPGGRILSRDVEALADSGPAHKEHAPESRDGDRREPLRGVRRTIAERMSAAHRMVPAVTHVEECDVTELDATRRLINERSGSRERLTFLPFIVKAAAAALERHPILNASLDEGASEIVFHDHVDIGVAVDTAAGLVVPVIRAAGERSVPALAEAIETLAARARAGTLAPEDTRGGTFTVTSPGAFGGVMATPIVLHPQAAILGVHRAADRPVVREGQIVIRKVMNLSVTFDHRILDGMAAARFALDIVEFLEHPAVLTLEG